MMVQMPGTEDLSEDGFLLIKLLRVSGAQHYHLEFQGPWTRGVTPRRCCLALLHLNSFRWPRAPHWRGMTSTIALGITGEVCH